MWSRQTGAFTYLGEDEVDFFERSTSGLRVEEVNCRNEQSIDDGKEEVAAECGRICKGWREHNHREVPKPVAASRNSVGFRPSFDRIDL